MNCSDRTKYPNSSKRKARSIISQGLYYLMSWITSLQRIRPFCIIFLNGPTANMPKWSWQVPIYELTWWFFKKGLQTRWTSPRDFNRRLQVVSEIKDWPTNLTQVPRFRLSWKKEWRKLKAFSSRNQSFSWVRNWRPSPRISGEHSMFAEKQWRFVRRRRGIKERKSLKKWLLITSSQATMSCTARLTSSVSKTSLKFKRFYWLVWHWKQGPK